MDALYADLYTAFTVMVMGMVFVFFFLSLLVAVISLNAKLFGDEPQPEQISLRQSSASPSPAVEAAIHAAVAKYRKQHNQV